MKGAFVFCVFFLLPSALSAKIVLCATKAAFIEGVTEAVENANRHGVYPVKLTWDAAGSVCDVYRADSADGIFVPIAQGIACAGRGEYIDANENGAPEQVFFYKIRCRAEESAAIQGYGALTQETYMQVYNRNIVASHSKLTLMFKRIALQKLGKEGADGDISGALSYHAKIQGLSGTVIIRYDNYSDAEHWVLTGNTNIKANIFANGKMYGTILCGGMYPGAVDYSRIVIRKGAAAGGVYVVMPEGFPSGNVLWNALASEDTGVADAEKI